MKYTIVSGDTLQMIAQRELGDALLWMDIASLNNLTYPYISNTTGTGVVTPGDIIDLPSYSTSTTVDNAEPSFGVDLYLSTDRFNITSGSGGDFSIGLDGDYSLAVEEDSMIQDNTHRLMTPKGSLPYHPEYGSYLPTMVGAKKDSTWAVKCQLELSRALKSDPRVEDVTNLSVTSIPTGMVIDYQALAKGIVFRPGGVL